MEFKFPDVGEGIAEAEIVEWIVKEGDKVKEDQNIVKVETDKAVVDLPAPVTGVISKIFKHKGETVKVGETLVTIETDEKKVEKKAVEKKVETKKEKPTEKKEFYQEAAKKQEDEEKEGQGVVGSLEVGTGELPAMTEPEEKHEEQKEEVKILPKIRKLAEEKGVDLNKIKGTGKDGRITEEDVKKAETKTEEKPKKTVAITKKYDLFGYVDHIPLKGLRKAIAKNMEIQKSIPAVTHMDEVDITRLYGIRETEKKKVKDVKLTYLPFIIKALIAALKDYPIANSVYTEEEIIVKKYYNIGIAVATEEGLIVPVIKGADEKSIHDIAKEIQTLAGKAKERTLDIMDLKGGTFTITNVGSIGGQYATPIINPGESAILALGRMYEKVIAKNGKAKIIKALPLSLTFDHRVFDGAEAAFFVNKIKEYLEDPNRLLLEN